MHVPIVMNYTTDTRYACNPSEPMDVAEAASRPDASWRKSYSAPDLENHDKLFPRFDPSVERTLFIPQLGGG